ncbi:MAG: hypothetical protein GY774_40015 [Planctomycetes bacterium]|nr:hypothetical protein [Planctomycetota bacterium]
MPSILKKYHDEITQALINYLEKGGSVASHKNAFKRGMVYAFGEAFELGWLDAGREIPFDSNAQAWLNARMEAELAHIDSVFVQAKELRKDDGDFFQWVTARADGYTSSVRAVYNAASMFAMKGKLLTWHLGETEEHCPTCEEVLNGTRHRASWYIARNYIPRQPGAGMDCGGYNCDCKLTDQKGNEVTL